MAEAAVQIDIDHPTLQVDVERLRTLALEVVAAEGGHIENLSIVLTDHESVLSLNREYLAHDYTTDVLSFDLSEDEDPGLVDGEVYVDLDTAQEQHEAFGASFEEEVQRYVVHGVLHLLGYDDTTPEQKATMHALEDRYLASAGSGAQG